jgi:hypothetical protein
VGHGITVNKRDRIMANLILRDFKLLRDFRSVNWGATVGYNLMRASAAGVVWGTIIFCISFNDRKPAWPMLAAPLFMPIAYLCFFLPLGFFFGALSSIVPFAGLFSIFFAIEAVTVGDPLISILHAIAPRFVPVQRPSFLSLALIYYVLKPEEAEQLVISR